MFFKESDLVNAFAKELENFAFKVIGEPNRNFFKLNEFDSKFGIADIVIGTYDEKKYQERHGRPVNKNWILPLLNLREGHWFSENDFAKKYQLSSSSTKLRLKEYEESGFLKKDESGVYFVIQNYEIFTNKVIAIEAKLKNWKRALHQAHRYKRFSDYSFVLLDYGSSSPAIKNLDFFKKNNIGLISLKKDGIEFHFIPPPNVERKKRNSILINEAAFEYISSNFAY